MSNDGDPSMSSCVKQAVNALNDWRNDVSSPRLFGEMLLDELGLNYEACNRLAGQSPAFAEALALAFETQYYRLSRVALGSGSGGKTGQATLARQLLAQMDGEANTLLSLGREPKSKTQDQRQNHHQDLAALSAMSDEALMALFYTLLEGE
ncbi:MAG: hypothetical protein KC476_03225 [Cyanobacteria bacterium HKST-UBA06]|nr:hypothetical protein [Cyanobacteria bacterium HKST-UBA06]